MNLHKKGWDPVLTKFQHFVIEKYFKTRNHFKTFLHTGFFCKLFDDARQFHSMCLDTKDAELVLIDQNLHQMSPYAHMIAPSWGLQNFFVTLKTNLLSVNLHNHTCNSSSEQFNIQVQFTLANNMPPISVAHKSMRKPLQCLIF